MITEVTRGRRSLTPGAWVGAVVVLGVAAAVVALAWLL